MKLSYVRQEYSLPPWRYPCPRLRLHRSTGKNSCVVLGSACSGSVGQNSSRSQTPQNSLEWNERPRTISFYSNSTNRSNVVTTDSHGSPTGVLWKQHENSLGLLCCSYETPMHCVSSTRPILLISLQNETKFDFHHCLSYRRTKHAFYVCQDSIPAPQPPYFLRSIFHFIGVPWEYDGSHTEALWKSRTVFPWPPMEDPQG